MIRHHFMIRKYHFVITTLYKRNLVRKCSRSCSLCAHTNIANTHTHSHEYINAGAAILIEWQVHENCELQD